MIRFFLIACLIALASCNSAKLQKYERIVQGAERFEIYYKSANKTVAVPDQQLGDFKEILVRNVKPEMQRKFINNVQINFYKKNRRTAYLMIADGDKNPYVDFHSDGLNFGFRLTYGIGMAIDDLYALSSR